MSAARRRPGAGRPALRQPWPGPADPVRPRPPSAGRGQRGAAAGRRAGLAGVHHVRPARRRRPHHRGRPGRPGRRLGGRRRTGFGDSPDVLSGNLFAIRLTRGRPVREHARRPGTPPGPMTRSSDRPSGRRSSSGRRGAFSGRRKPVVLAVLGALLALVLALYIAGFLLAGDRLPKDAQVSGVAVGGLDRAQAIEKLTAELGARAAKPIEVTASGKTGQVTPADAGLADRLRTECRRSRRRQELRSPQDRHGAGRRPVHRRGRRRGRGQVERRRAEPGRHHRPGAGRRGVGVPGHGGQADPG